MSDAEYAAEQRLCGAPCPNGGLESHRRRANVDLGWVGHCNRRVQRPGGRCWQHLLPTASPGEGCSTCDQPLDSPGCSVGPDRTPAHTVGGGCQAASPGEES